MPLDTSPAAEHVLPIAELLARSFGCELRLLTAHDEGGVSHADAERYLASVVDDLRATGHEVEAVLRPGRPDEVIGEEARREGIDAVLMATDGRSRIERWLSASVTSNVIYQTTPPLYLVRPTDAWQSIRTRFARILVALDGSATAEQVLPHVPALANRFGSEMLLLSAKEGAESDAYATTARTYLDGIAAALRAGGATVRTLVEEGAPSRVILQVANRERSDLIMMVSHGRGGVARQQHVKLGSVVETVLQETRCPVFLVSARPDPEAGLTARLEPPMSDRTGLG